MDDQKFIKPGGLLFIFIIWILILVFVTTNHALPTIKKEVLSDGVEKWYHEKPSTERPAFFEQLQDLFDVIIPANKNLPFEKSIAFLVGVSTYHNITTQLPSVKNDLEDIRIFLLNNGGFDMVYVAKEQIVNRDLVEKYIKEILPQHLDDNDRLLFYYSGHGDDNEGDTGYMQFANAEPGRFYGNQVLQINVARTWCSELKARHLVFIFDCCASGLAFTAKGSREDSYEQLIATLSHSGSHTIITAGTADERAFAVKNSKGKKNGVFTRAFLNALVSGTADRGCDGFITLDEVMAQVKTEIAGFRVQYQKSITPQMWPLDVSEYKGAFVFLNPRAKQQHTALKDDYAASLETIPIPKGHVVAAYGIIQLTSYISGSVYIDGKYSGNISSGDAIRIPDQSVGSHHVEVRTTNQIYSQTADVAKGKLNRVTIGLDVQEIPEINSESTANNSRIDSTRPFRSEARKLSKEDVKAMLKKHDFCSRGDKYNPDLDNPTGKGIENQYVLGKSNKVIFDRACKLMWQQSGASNNMIYEDAKMYIRKLNEQKFAGYDDWRLPTLEEAMTLLEGTTEHGDLHISPKFNKLQRWIWTCDLMKDSPDATWIVNFARGYPMGYNMKNESFVRAVRFEKRVKYIKFRR